MTIDSRLLVAGAVESPLYSESIVPDSSDTANPISERIPGIWNLATDSEWEKLRGLCTQVADDEGMGWIFWHPLAVEVLGEIQLRTITLECGGIPVFTSITPLDWMLAHVARPKTMKLKMFYSPKDLEYFMGWDAFKSLIDKGWVEQKRRITIRTSPMFQGAIYGIDGLWYASRKHCKQSTGDDGLRIIIDDLKGNAAGSLGDMGDAVGKPMNKDILDPRTGKAFDKGLMGQALKHNPSDFIRYALDDVHSLHGIRDAFNTEVIRIAREFFGIELKDSEVKGTNGALVALCFKKWIEQQDALMPYALVKLGRLSLSLSGDALDDAVSLKNEVEQWFLTYGPDEVLAMAECDAEMGKSLKKYLKLPMVTPTLAAGSSVGLGSYKTTLAYSAMVQGGRAVNEAPHKYRIGRGADIDLASCYGSSLKRFTYPVGLPETLHYTQEETAKRVKLRKFSKGHESELIDGLWTATVSGDLPYSQDLIFSKRTTIAKINKAVSSEDDSQVDVTGKVLDDVAKLPGDFALTRREIVNGVVTGEILEALDRVATKAERAHINALSIESAVWYPASKRDDSVRDWALNVLSSTGGVTSISDERYDGWVGLPITGFIGPLLEERGRLKTAMKGAEGGERVRLNAEQTMLKLFINTLYGCLASPYFEIGNAVVANNITASARRGAWQMAKALGSVQSITDGGSYALDAVRFIAPSAALPGLDKLSSHAAWKDTKKGRTVDGLGRKDWGGTAWDELLSMTTKQAEKSLDALALAHIQEFWGRYGLGFNFAIEHKGKNTFEALAYWNKTDYAMMTAQFSDSDSDVEAWYTTNDGVTLDLARCTMKVRGERFDRSNTETVAPKIELLIHILADSPTVPSKTTWVQTTLLSLKDYVRGLGGEGKRPGDEIVSKRMVKLKNSHIYATDYREVDKRDKRKQGFEKFSDLGIEGMHNRMVKDRL